MNSLPKSYAAMPEVYCALNAKAFLDGSFAKMSREQQQSFLESRHRLHTYETDMQRIQQRDIFRDIGLK